MSSLLYLRDVILGRLTAAAEDIFTHVERIVVEYEEEVDRQRKQLAVVCKRKVKLQRKGLPQQKVNEEGQTKQQLCNQERNPCLDLEEPESLQIKEEEEADTFMLTPDNDESDHMEPEPDTDHQLLSTVAESQDQTEINPGEENVALYEEEVDQRRQLKILWKPEVQLQQIELPQHHVYNEQKVLTEQEGNSNVDQEEPESLQIKGEEEICTRQEQLELKQEADTFMLTPDNEESDHMIPEPDTDHQLLSAVAESQDQTGCNDVQKIIVKYEEEVENLWKPEVQLEQIELPQQNVHKEEEDVLTEQQLCNQERNSSVDQEEPELLQIKEEEEEICTSQVQEQLVKEEIDTFIVSFDDEEGDHMEPEPDTDHQLISPESQDQTVHMSDITGEKAHVCSICKKCFACKGTLMIHKRTHTGEKPYSCETCGKRFRQNSHLINHKITHTGEKPFVCNICKKCFGRNDSLIEHMTTHTGERLFSCETCGKSFRQRQYLKIHKRSHTGEKPYCCETCGKCFQHRQYLINHKSTHTGEKPHICSVCQTCFARKYRLVEHMKTHTGEKPHICHICQKCFMMKSNLIDHMRTHTGEKPYSCETCGKCFRQLAHLIKHKRIHSGEKPHICNICKTGFTLKENLMEHMRIHTGEKPFSCETCGKSFRHRPSLRIHIKTHTREDPYAQHL